MQGRKRRGEKKGIEENKATKVGRKEKRFGFVDLDEDTHDNRYTQIAIQIQKIMKKSPNNN
jgi:hypothetical protein